MEKLQIRIQLAGRLVCEKNRDEIVVFARRGARETKKLLKGHPLISLDSLEEDSGLCKRSKFLNLCNGFPPPQLPLRSTLMGVLKEKQKSGIGGLIRDDKGQWLGGFYSSLPNCESLEGKLHGILKALQIIEDRDLHAASVETGSLIADQLLTNRQIKEKYLFGSGAVNAKMEGRWLKTPDMNSSPTLDIPWREDPSDAMNTFFPFSDKLIWTCDPEPMSSNAYLGRQDGMNK
ncbi:hypothetical protein RJ639_010057 [Escallonia herrerae]|uniref:RNase H type-1 domain-containing protein n=1 Tax=Escallonia herrerae TaxID=1293975 RepID=A0AA88VSP2_9ASTE|nr:hypothetical protein RJ639_010057 [Escallonia herrerae]